MDLRRTARIAGILFILTFVTSIAARLMFIDGLGGSWEDLHFTGTTSETTMYLAAVFEFALIVTNIGTAVVLYPVVKRHSEGLALGYVTARIMESAFIMVGLLSLLAAVTLTQDLAGAGAAEAASMMTTGETLVSTYEWSFLFGPGLVVGFGNGLILGYLMYRSELVPRRMAMLGLVGGPLLIVAFLGVLFDVFEMGSAAQALLMVPEIIWEASFGIYLTVKGFKSTRTVAAEPAPASPEPSMATA